MYNIDDMHALNVNVGVVMQLSSDIVNFYLHVFFGSVHVQI